MTLSFILEYMHTSQELETLMLMETPYTTY